MRKRYDTLVLNLAYCPIHIIDWDKAISLIYQEKARPLDISYIAYTFQEWLEFTKTNADGYYKVHGVNFNIALPEIIVSTTFNRLPERQVKYSRQTVFTRDKYRCGYCGKTFRHKELTVDHILPKCLGGKTEWNNVISCCYSCNQSKADKTLKTAGLKLIFKPHKPGWNSPLQNINIETHPCKSWKHFMKRMDTTLEE